MPLRSFLFQGLPQTYRLTRCVTFSIISLITVPVVNSAEPVTKTINVFDIVKQGAVEYHLNQNKEIHDDPSDVWSFQPDGTLRVSGRGYGYLATTEEFEDYHLVLEFKWGEATWGNRKDRARDNGLLLHAYGPHGAYGGTWMASIECQIIEGGTGDILVLSTRPKRDNGLELTTRVTCEITRDRDNERVWKKGEPPQEVTTGRINWKDRDVDWVDEKGFRGRQDIEKPVGKWNRLEVIADGDTLQYFLNGVFVNEATNVAPSKGRILLQSEGAEMFVRRFELRPVGEQKTHSETR